MPSLLIALGVVALYFLTPKSARTGGFAVLQTPANTPIGINTGLIVPSAQAGGSPGPVAGVVNAPGTGQSGVPQASPQAQSVVPKASPAPSEFYSYPGVFAPTFVPTRVPKSSGGSANCGGCSGGCGGTPKSKAASDCATSVARATNSGCLAPTTRSLFTSQNEPFFNNWFANVASDPDANAFTAYRAANQSQQDMSPLSEQDNAPSIGFVSPVIGLNKHRPTAGRVA